MKLLSLNDSSRSSIAVEVRHSAGKVFRSLQFGFDERFVDDHLRSDIRQFTFLPRFNLLSHRLEVSLHAINANRNAVDERERLRVVLPTASRKCYLGAIKSCRSKLFDLCGCQTRFVQRLVSDTAFSPPESFSDATSCGRRPKGMGLAVDSPRHGVSRLLIDSDSIASAIRLRRSSWRMATTRSDQEPSSLVENLDAGHLRARDDRREDRSAGAMLERIMPKTQAVQ
jgi:hypothetical protein